MEDREQQQRGERREKGLVLDGERETEREEEVKKAHPR